MQQIALPLVTIGNFTFNVTAIVGIDWSGYQPQRRDEDGKANEIEIILIGGSSYIFEAEEAEAFKLWFDKVTGKSRITPASGIGLVSNQH